ncbi:YcbK family protein [Jiella endophytica]|uniref:YcbK family protein n=1 Tax=Jiella endophytica TaxID=2558362 RepID=UPI001FE0AD2E|nr:D-Ala-D-Ala carboxypeptidase family metallohydrolase [Jiella endophytica]
MDDTSAFGFATASNSQPAAAASGSGDPAAAASEGATTSAEEIAAAAAAKPEVADDASAGTAVAAASSDKPDEKGAKVAGEAGSLRDRMTTARAAAFAGGTVAEGDAVGEPSERKVGEKSLFASLFAREAAKTPLANAEKGKSRRIVLKRDEPVEQGGGGIADLPGVDPSSLFEIGQKASANEDAIDDVMSSYQVASLGGFARLAPNGLSVARDDVQTSCFPADLVGQIRAIERRFGAKAVITSGYRSPAHNARVNGARRSQHMGCKAADLIVPGANPMKVAAFVRALPGRGGVGTYCHTQAIHIDVGPKRDWNWRCRRRQ